MENFSPFNPQDLSLLYAWLQALLISVLAKYLPEADNTVIGIPEISGNHPEITICRTVSGIYVYSFYFNEYGRICFEALPNGDIALKISDRAHPAISQIADKILESGFVQSHSQLLVSNGGEYFEDSRQIGGETKALRTWPTAESPARIPQKNVLVAYRRSEES